MGRLVLGMFSDRMFGDGTFCLGTVFLSSFIFKFSFLLYVIFCAADPEGDAALPEHAPAHHHRQGPHTRQSQLLSLPGMYVLVCLKLIVS